MRTKTVVGMAVASALSWSYGAMAAENFGHMGADSTYGVVTPFSPNESGPADLPHGTRYSSLGAEHASAGAAVDHEVVTPLADNESGPHDIMLQRRGHSFHAARDMRSMANPQTPWSPSESGVNAYNEDTLGHARQVAEVEQARIAAREWNANLAARSSSDLDTSASLSEPVGGTSGLGLQGSNERSVDPSQPSASEPSRQSQFSEPSSSDWRSDAGMPSEIERTSAMRSESEYAIPVTQYNTVGILETPAEPSEYTVWSVEPLNPGADIATGDTIYVVPGDAEVAFVPDFGQSSPLGASGEYSAGVTDESSEANEPSSL